MWDNRKQLSQFKKWLRYRFTYQTLATLPYAPAYAQVSKLDNLMFDEMQDSRSAYEDQLKNFLPFLQVDSAKLEHYLQLQSRLRSRGELDAIWPHRKGRRNPQDFCQFHTEDFVAELKNSGDGVIIVMGHYGRPTRLLHYLALLGVQTGLLTQTFDPNLINLDRQEMTFRMLGMNNLLGMTGGPWFTLQAAMNPLYRALKSGQWIVIMCDLFEPAAKAQLEMPFMGGKFLAPSGIPRLARKTGARLVYGVGKEDLSGAVHLSLKPLPEDPELGLISAFSELEKDVCEYPWQWHHWHVMREAWQRNECPVLSPE